MKIALVHDMLLSLGGAERVLMALHDLWPDAPIYTLLADETTQRTYFSNAVIHTSGIQAIPGAIGLRRLIAPLMVPAIESFDLSDYDTVISSSVTFAKGVIVRPFTRHICYCYSPSRPLWDRAHEYEYKHRLSRHMLRLWDGEAAQRVDQFIAISDHVRQRIQKYYRRDATIIYPPVPQLPMPASEPFLSEPYYIIISRLVPHKNLELAVDTFNKLGHTLVIIGDGPLRARLETRAEANVLLKGFLGDQALATWLAHAHALIVPCEEDFGLTAVEALQVGVPVLALRKGGVLEIVQEGITGEFFDDPIPEALADGVKRLQRQRELYDPKTLHKSSKKFDMQHFQRSIRKVVSS